MTDLSKLTTKQLRLLIEKKENTIASIERDIEAYNTEYAQGVMDKLFENFPVGSGWLRKVEKEGQENLFIENTLGARRHLWGYLHTRTSIIRAMNRRGPNFILQGTASSIGVISMRIMQSLAWHYFVKHGVPYHFKSSTNFVHDSVEGEAPIHTVPIYMYFIEHASTTLIHKKLSKYYGYDLTIGLEMEFQMGASIDRCKKWDFMPDTLFDMMEKEIEFSKTDLGYTDVDYDWEVATAKKNWEIIQDLRKRELDISLKSRKPVKVMLMTEKNARNIGLIIEDRGYGCF